MVCTKAGDMVLWDSRTIHCNSPALLSEDEMKERHLKSGKQEKEKEDGVENKNDDDIDVDVDGGQKMEMLDGLIDTFENEKEIKQTVEFLRLVGMICMLPKSHLKDKQVVKLRKQAYIDKQTLSHWPIEYCGLCGHRVDAVKIKFKMLMN